MEAHGSPAGTGEQIERAELGHSGHPANACRSAMTARPRRMMMMSEERIMRHAPVRD
jgi:hypothetical protein